MYLDSHFFSNKLRFVVVKFLPPLPCWGFVYLWALGEILAHWSVSLSKQLRQLSWTAWSSETTKSTHTAAAAVTAAAGEVLIWMETLSRGITRKQSRAVAFGQGLRLAGWPGLRVLFRSFFCDTHKRTYRVPSHPLHSSLFRPLALPRISSLLLHCIRESKADENPGRGGRDWGDTGGRGKPRHTLGFPNDKPGYCLIHSAWR